MSPKETPSSLAREADPKRDRPGQAGDLRSCLVSWVRRPSRELLASLVDRGLLPLFRASGLGDEAIQIRCRSMVLTVTAACRRRAVSVPKSGETIRVGSKLKRAHVSIRLVDSEAGADLWSTGQLSKILASHIIFPSNISTRAVSEDGERCHTCSSLSLSFSLSSAALLRPSLVPWEVGQPRTQARSPTICLRHQHLTIPPRTAEPTCRCRNIYALHGLRLAPTTLAPSNSSFIQLGLPADQSPFEDDHGPSTGARQGCVSMAARDLSSL